MEEKKSTFQNIDEYVQQFSPELQEKLQTLRNAIKEVAPEAAEKISYQMPTFHLHGNLVHFAAFTNHIGFYPTPSGIETFQQELAEYKTSKGAVQFPIERQLPYELIKAIVKFRVKENIEKAENKKKRSK